jgi:hypothetical protein
VAGLRASAAHYVDSAARARAEGRSP